MGRRLLKLLKKADADLDVDAFVDDSPRSAAPRSITMAPFARFGAR